jgi:hypothetical protein
MVGILYDRVGGESGIILRTLRMPITDRCRGCCVRVAVRRPLWSALSLPCRTHKNDTLRQTVVCRERQQQLVLAGSAAHACEAVFENPAGLKLLNSEAIEW